MISAPKFWCLGVQLGCPGRCSYETLTWSPGAESYQTQVKQFPSFQRRAFLPNPLLTQGPGCPLPCNGHMRQPREDSLSRDPAGMDRGATLLAAANQLASGGGSPDAATLT